MNIRGNEKMREPKLLQLGDLEKGQKVTLKIEGKHCGVRLITSLEFKNELEQKNHAHHRKMELVTSFWEKTIPEADKWIVIVSSNFPFETEIKIC